MKKLSQALIVLLALDAGWVANGLVHHSDMWKWIVLYWVLLTMKNLADWIAGRKQNGDR